MTVTGGIFNKDLSCQSVPMHMMVDSDDESWAVQHDPAVKPSMVKTGSSTHPTAPSPDVTELLGQMKKMQEEIKTLTQAPDLLTPGDLVDATCGTCGRHPMILRENRSDKSCFLGCQSFATKSCTGTMRIKGQVEKWTPSPHKEDAGPEGKGTTPF